MRLRSLLAGLLLALAVLHAQAATILLRPPAGGSGRPALTTTSPTYGASASGFGTQLTGGRGQAAFVLASGPFTVECFVTPSQVSSFSMPMALSDGTHYAAFVVDGSPRVAYTGSGTLSGPTMSAGTRYHVVIEYDTTNLILMVNGSLASYGASAAFTNPTLYLAAAGSNNAYDGTSAGNGSLDECRFSKTVRYSPSGYTAPSAPLTADADALGLYHLDGSGASD